MKDLDELTAWTGALLRRLDAKQRRTLMRAIGTELRRRQTARIAEQRNPDGSAYEPRKRQLRQRVGRVRRTMFARLRTSRHLRARGDADMAVVRFVGGARRIAEVHHYGLRDRVNRGGLEVEFARQELLGLEDGDVEWLGDVVLAHIVIDRLHAAP
jgi:phage virion morphogenesis protein